MTDSAGPPLASRVCAAALCHLPPRRTPRLVVTLFKNVSPEIPDVARMQAATPWTRCLTVPLALFLAITAGVIAFALHRADPQLISVNSTGPLDLKDVTSPVLEGALLSLFADALRVPLLGGLIVGKIKHDNDFKHLRSFAASIPHPNPLFFPYNATHAAILSSVAPSASSPAASAPSATQHPTSRILRLHSKYQSGATDPSKVIARVLDAINKSNSMLPPLHSFLSARAGATADAELSTQRWKEGRPLGLLDGIPVAVKVEFEVAGERHSHGTQFITRVSAKDAEPVARLRAAGAIIVGITNMHEIGIGTSGHNPWTGSARNPYNTSHLTGGSSSGSASAVAAGIVPISLAADGGGSIRIPAALCGVIGLKPTFGRVPCDADLAFTVGHAGRTLCSSLFYRTPSETPQPSPPASKTLASCTRPTRQRIVWFLTPMLQVLYDCRAAVSAASALRPLVSLLWRQRSNRHPRGSNAELQRIRNRRSAELDELNHRLAAATRSNHRQCHHPSPLCRFQSSCGFYFD